ncbi:type III-A CRISPR-associated protein Csm2 [Candidatus Bathyarchaeota archaeon]|nr:type III-A CRISPR-associated protein Csm2 [Candidatus Bathyarchaeota archaeon]
MNEIERIIENIKDPDWGELVKEGGLIDMYSRKVTIRHIATNLLRRFFDELKQIELTSITNIEELTTRLWLMVPAVKYAIGRNAAPESFGALISKGIPIVCKPGDDEEVLKRFTTFVNIFEALMAYHKFNEELMKKMRYR